MTESTTSTVSVPKTREQLTLESLIPATKAFTQELDRCLKERATSFHRLHIRLKKGYIEHCQTESGEVHNIEEPEEELDVKGEES